MMRLAIGEAAGRLWQYLAGSGAAAPRELPKQVGIDRDLCFWALGWLAREGKVRFEKRGKDLIVSLTEEELRHKRR